MKSIKHFKSIQNFHALVFTITLSIVVYLFVLLKKYFQDFLFADVIHIGSFQHISQTFISKIQISLLVIEIIIYWGSFVYGMKLSFCDKFNLSTRQLHVRIYLEDCGTWLRIFPLDTIPYQLSYLHLPKYPDLKGLVISGRMLPTQYLWYH